MSSNSILRLDTEVRYSEAVTHNGTVYLSGQITRDDTLDAQGQTENVLQQIEVLLERAGSNKCRCAMLCICEQT